MTAKRKFMQQLNEPVFGKVKRSAKTRGVTFQALIRVMCADYVRTTKRKEKRKK